MDVISKPNELEIKKWGCGNNGIIGIDIFWYWVTLSTWCCIHSLCLLGNYIHLNVPGDTSLWHGYLFTYRLCLMKSIDTYCLHMITILCCWCGFNPCKRGSYQTVTSNQIKLKSHLIKSNTLQDCYICSYPLKAVDAIINSPLR